jgi:hypothetical protein
VLIPLSLTLVFALLFIESRDGSTGTDRLEL